MATPKEYFDGMIKQKVDETSDVSEFDAVYKFIVEGDGGGTWTLNLKDDKGIFEGEKGEPDVTITIGSEDFIEMMEGNLNPNMAFMSQKMKVEGDMMAAMKLNPLIGY